MSRSRYKERGKETGDHETAPQEIVSWGRRRRTYRSLLRCKPARGSSISTNQGVVCSARSRASGAEGIEGQRVWATSG